MYQPRNLGPLSLFGLKTIKATSNQLFGRSSSDRLRDMQVARKQTVPMAVSEPSPVFWGYKRCEPAVAL